MKNTHKITITRSMRGYINETDWYNNQGPNGDLNDPECDRMRDVLDSAPRRKDGSKILVLDTEGIAFFYAEARYAQQTYEDVGLQNAGRAMRRRIESLGFHWEGGLTGRLVPNAPLLDHEHRFDACYRCGTGELDSSG